MSPLFVATADLHFDELGPWRFRGILGDADYSMAQVVDYCLENRPRRLLLLGDLMNRPNPSASAVRSLCAHFDRLQAAEVPVDYILGNHDGRQDWPRLHPWPVHRDGQVIDLGDAASAYCLDYRPRGRLQEALAATPSRCCALVAHQAWSEFFGLAAQGSLEEVPEHIQYVLSGDNHAPIAAPLPRGGSFWSPGSTHPTTVTEDSPRSFLVGHWRGDQLACDQIMLATRAVYRMKVESVEALAALDDGWWVRLVENAAASAGHYGLPEALARPIVDVQYYTDVPGAFERLRAREGLVHLFLRPRDRQRVVRRGQAAVVDLTVAEAVGRLAAAGTPGFDWTMRLLQAPDRAAEWKAIVKEVTDARI